MMEVSHIMKKFKCYGSTTVGTRGQIVIPASARKEMGIETGDTILAFSGIGGHHGLLLLKADNLEDMVQMMSAGLARISQIIKENGSGVSENADEE